jgi:Domain of unknown function (DUF4440)
MRPMLRPALLLLVLAAAPAFAADEVVLPEPTALRAQIAARDQELFDVLFEQCAPDKMRALVTEDIEFYHDKDGVTLGADKFVGDYAGFCEERKKPDAWRSRRKLVEGTLTVDPVPGVGAIETGEHLFYERQGEGPQKLVGRAKFAQLWKLTPDGWRLARVFSYAHGPASE